MMPERVNQMKEDLKADPPIPFDLTRKLRVFTAAAEFVELKILNYKLSKHRVSLPEEFLRVDDADLKKRISGQLRAPLDGIGVQNVVIEIKNETEGELQVDEAFIEKERKEIEDQFTYVLPKKGRVILKRDRADFDRQIERLEQIVQKYQAGLKTSVEAAREGFKEHMLEEFENRWKSNPPSFLRRRSDGNHPDRIKEAILSRADQLFSMTVNFAPPEVVVNYKGIVIEDIKDHDFREKLHVAMKKANVDQGTLGKLFEIGDAAAAQHSFGRN